MSVPLLFVSHGAPTFALEQEGLARQLRVLGPQLPAVRAVLVVSAHWETPGGIAVTGSAQPETIHDFGGFPPALYALQYPAPGDPQLADAVVRSLAAAGWPVRFDPQRGLDHGAWVPLLHLFPDASLPVIQVSLPQGCTAAQALQLGRDLAGLREQGVLIMGSGSLTHNLRDVWQNPADAGYVERFSHWVAEAVDGDDTQSLLGWQQHPDARRAHPSAEHFLPLLTVQGARGTGDALRVLDGGISHGVLAMSAYLLGDPV